MMEITTGPSHIPRSRRLSIHSIRAGALVAAGSILGGLGLAQPEAQALVKGNAPPADLRKKGTAGGKPKAGNVEDARELGRKKVGGCGCGCRCGCRRSGLMGLAIRGGGPSIPFMPS